MQSLFRLSKPVSGQKKSSQPGQHYVQTTNYDNQFYTDIFKTLRKISFFNYQRKKMHFIMYKFKFNYFFQGESLRSSNKKKIMFIKIL